MLTLPHKYKLLGESLMDSNITKKKFVKREYIYRKRIPYG